MGNYDAEQGHEHTGGGPTLATDLKPYLREQHGLEVSLSEFPYYHYAGEDYPPRENEDVAHWMDQMDVELDDVPESIKRIGPFRTDVVGVSVDRRALHQRIQRTGHYTPLNQHGSGKRRNRRTYLTFTGDGPMRRAYWEKQHGGPDELRGYGESSASTAFGWLKKRNYLLPVGGGAYDAVKLPLHVHGRIHAFELKLTAGEWRTALEQAGRADCYADYRWVVYDRDTASEALENTECFQTEGVGLITVHPDDGGTTHVWPRQCTRDVDRVMLDRYMVERWDVNERVLKKLEAAHQPGALDAVNDGAGEDWTLMDMYGVNSDILGEINADDIRREPHPPTANGYRGGTEDGAVDVARDAGHKPLTSFTGDGGE